MRNGAGEINFGFIEPMNAKAQRGKGARGSEGRSWKIEVGR
jgi:hypothetical protein